MFVRLYWHLIQTAFKNYKWVVVCLCFFLEKNIKFLVVKNRLYVSYAVSNSYPLALNDLCLHMQMYLKHL
jgi:hypothetical protein